MSTVVSAPSWRSPALWGNIVSLLALALLAAGLFKLQKGDWWLATPVSERWIAASLSLFAYLLFCALIFWRSRPHASTDDEHDASPHPPVLVACASQTGFAQQLAVRTADSLRQSGIAVKLRSLGQVDNALLASSQRALFIVSTTGEGDPPDAALAFVRHVMASSATLGHLHYAVLALGDREYEDFCGFGHQLDDWLRQHGGQSLFDIVEVDNADESALRHWQHHLGLIGGVTDLPDWAPASYESWKLLERNELNPGSVGGGVFHLSIAPPAGSAPQWLAGDIAEIGPQHSQRTVSCLLEALKMDAGTSIQWAGGQQTLGDAVARSHLPAPDELLGLDAQAIADQLKPLPHREYSIASLPADGTLQLLLRRMLRPDGTPGIGSGWLCNHATPGNDIALRIRSNPNFHPPAINQPMILIGNGTGIAGLRAHLKVRIAAGARRNWLLFGERNRDRDFFFANEITQWQTQGYLERVDLAFSRDQEERVYVQQKLRAAGETLAQWVEAGAVIYVCGSMAGMAPGVDAVMRDQLGDAQVEMLLATGRYRRDVY